jgi:hypothetical protein
MNSNKDYKKLYIKYKNKYINLKKQYGGNDYCQSYYSKMDYNQAKWYHHIGAFFSDCDYNEHKKIQLQQIIKPEMIKIINRCNEELKKIEQKNIHNSEKCIEVSKIKKMCDFDMDLMILNKQSELRNKNPEEFRQYSFDINHGTNACTFDIKSKKSNPECEKLNRNREEMLKMIEAKKGCTGNIDYNYTNRLLP